MLMVVMVEVVLVLETPNSPHKNIILADTGVRKIFYFQFLAKYIS